jgi:hypothetical protein
MSRHRTYRVTTRQSSSEERKREREKDDDVGQTFFLSLTHFNAYPNLSPIKWRWGEERKEGK